MSELSDPHFKPCLDWLTNIIQIHSMILGYILTCLEYSWAYNMVRAWADVDRCSEHAWQQEETNDSLSSCDLITDMSFVISGDFSVQFEVEEYPSSNVYLVMFLGAASSQGIPSTLRIFFTFTI